MTTSPLAGKPAPKELLIDPPRLIEAYYALQPDPAEPAHAVIFGTSGHRGSALRHSFNEAHVLAISEAICRTRAAQGIDGPLFIGIDTHALSEPAIGTALEVFAAHGVEVRMERRVNGITDPTPTPALSLAILAWNRERHARHGGRGLADGIVITPSHNPPEDGGFKYNPPHGGPADSSITSAIEREANALLKSRLMSVKRLSLGAALDASTTQTHDFLGEYVEALDSVIDFEPMRAARLRLGVDPLGGAGVHYWERISERYRIDLTVTRHTIDPTFSFMSVDHDGRIRMDPSSSAAMQALIASKNDFDIAFGCDTDHDRHGIVTPAGLMPPNHYLAVCIDYLFTHRPQWPASAAIGKTAVSTMMIDRVAARLGRKVHEVPVGFKWFVDGLYDSSLGFAGEESAGASFLRRDGTVWTTEKDGLIAGLLAGEMLARLGQDPAQRYASLEKDFGVLHATRVDAPANAAQRARLGRLTPAALATTTLAGDVIVSASSQAPGNGAALGGVKVATANGWFAARPSGTEDLYKIYAESARGSDHLRRLIEEAQSLVDQALNSDPTK